MVGAVSVMGVVIAGCACGGDWTYRVARLGLPMSRRRAVPAFGTRVPQTTTLVVASSSGFGVGLSVPPATGCRSLLSRCCLNSDWRNPAKGCRLTVAAAGSGLTAVAGLQGARRLSFEYLCPWVARIATKSDFLPEPSCAVISGMHRNNPYLAGGFRQQCKSNRSCHAPPSEVATHIKSKHAPSWLGRWLWLAGDGSDPQQAAIEASREDRMKHR